MITSPIACNITVIHQNLPGLSLCSLRGRSQRGTPQQDQGWSDWLSPNYAGGIVGVQYERGGLVVFVRGVSEFSSAK